MDSPEQLKHELKTARHYQFKSHDTVKYGAGENGPLQLILSAQIP